MARARGILKGWQCRRLRASLVDCAEGSLDAAGEARVRRHAADCADCAAALASLEQIPTMLRAVPPSVRDEDFWRRQRQSILRRARQVEAPAKPSLAPRFTWTAGLAAAAAVLVVLATYRSPAPPLSPGAGPVDGLGDDDVVALAEITDAWNGELLAPPVLDEEVLLSEDLPWIDGQAAAAADVSDLDEDDLERLEELIG